MMRTVLVGRGILAAARGLDDAHVWVQLLLVPMHVRLAGKAATAASAAYVRFLASVGAHVTFFVLFCIEWGGMYVNKIGNNYHT
jgi:hypothetical protein